MPPKRPAKRCSECREILATTRPNARTCSAQCRVKRARRIKAAQYVSPPASPHMQIMRETAREMVPDEARQIIREELRPVVREAIDQKVVEGLHDLLGLTPKVVAAISEDLESSDKDLRQKAYGHVMRYTLGRADLTPDSKNSTKPIEVHFNVPRAGETTQVVEAVSDELKMCDMCGAEKTLNQMYGESDRCIDCYNEGQERMKGLLGAG